MTFFWPKEYRRLAQSGHEALAVIVGFRSSSIEGAPSVLPVARWVAPDGSHRTASNGLSAYARDAASDPRGRGDVLHLLVPADGTDLAVVLAEPQPAAEHARRLHETTRSWNPVTAARNLTTRPAQWGRRVEGEVVALEAQPDGGTRVRVRYADREEILGPTLQAPDPRQVGDVVDLGLDEQGALVRAPEGPASGGAERRLEIAREPGLLRKLWDSPFSPF